MFLNLLNLGGSFSEHPESLKGRDAQIRIASDLKRRFILQIRIVSDLKRLRRVWGPGGSVRGFGRSRMMGPHHVTSSEDRTATPHPLDPSQAQRLGTPSSVATCPEASRARSSFLLLICYSIAVLRTCIAISPTPDMPLTAHCQCHWVDIVRYTRIASNETRDRRRAPLPLGIH